MGITVNNVVIRADDPITAPAGHLSPAAHDTYDLGVTGTRWRRVNIRWNCTVRIHAATT